MASSPANWVLGSCAFTRNRLSPAPVRPSIHIWAAATIMWQSLTSLNPSRSVECLFKDHKPVSEGQMVRSAGLLRARHQCGLSSLRSLYRLRPPWISVNLCQLSWIKENIYKALLCPSGLEKHQGFSSSSSCIQLSALHFNSVSVVRWPCTAQFNVEDGGGCEGALTELLMYGGALILALFLTLPWHGWSAACQSPEDPGESWELGVFPQGPLAFLIESSAPS